MALKIQKLKITNKRNSQYLQVTYKQDEVTKDLQKFDAKYVKTSNQPMTSQLINAIDTLLPHLLFASEKIDGTLKLNGELDYEKWFNDHDFKDDERFENCYVTGIELTGNESYEGIKILGYWETQNTAKPVKNNFFTGVIALDKMAENRYALSSLLCDHVDDLMTLVEAWLIKMETTPSNQLSIAV